MRKLLFILLLFPLTSYGKSPVSSDSASCGINGSSTSCTATLSGAAAGDTIPIVVALGAYAGSPATFVSLTSDNSDTIVQLASLYINSNVTMRLFVIPKAVGGSTTLTLTVTPGNTSYNAISLAALDYPGTAASPVEYLAPLTSSYNAASIATKTAYSSTSNTTAIAFGISSEPGVTAYTATGWTSGSTFSNSFTSASSAQLNAAVIGFTTPPVITGGTQVTGNVQITGNTQLQ